MMFHDESCDHESCGNENNASESVQASVNHDQEVQGLRDRYAYLVADFDTYRRRTAQERAYAVIQAQAKILRDVIGLHDDMERAYASLHGGVVSESVASGLQLVQKNCAKILEQNGVKEISQMRTFDPSLHEALMQVPATPDFPAGTIVTVFEKGYEHNNTLLRPARVSVAQDNA